MQNQEPHSTRKTRPGQPGIPMPAAWLAMAAALLGFVHWPRVPLAEVIAGIAFLAVGWHHATARTRMSGTSIPALLACAWIMSGLLHGHTMPVIREIAQILGVFLAGATVFAATWRIRPIALPAAVSVGWATCMLLGLLQRISGITLVHGSLGNRPMFALIMAGLTPLVLGILAQDAGSATRRNAAAFLLFATPFTLTFLPGLLLFMLGSVAWLILCADRSWQRMTACAFILGLSLAVLMNRTQLPESVALQNREGMHRRWSLEARAAIKAIGECPVSGYGPGTYQAVVSSGKFRAFLPRTAENKVEPGTQCGYLVLAVEYGLPAAVLVFLALLAGALRAWQAGPVKLAHPLAVCLALTAMGMFFTPLIVQGAGMLLSLLLGGAVAVTGNPENRPAAGAWSFADHVSAIPGQACALLIAGIAASMLQVATPAAPVSGTDTPVTPPKNGPIPFPEKANVILLEAEAATRIKQSAPALVVDQDEQASNSRALRVTNAFTKNTARQNSLSYPVTIAEPGTYKLWVRAWWEDGCGNSVAAQVGNNKSALVGNDGTYRVWHWVEGPVFNLQSGKQVFTLIPRESGARIDQMLLIDDRTFRPMGILTDKGVMPAPRTPPAQKQTLAQWTSVGRKPQKRFRAAIGGMYQNGPESFMVQMGIPYDRLQDDELGELAILKRYDLIWFSGPQSRHSAIWKAVNAYIRAGGTAILEKMGEGRIIKRFPYTAEEREVVPIGRISDTHRSNRPWKRRGRDRGPIFVRGEGSPFFAGLQPQEELYRDVLVGTIPKAPPGGEAHGGLYDHHGKRIGVVFTKRRFGRGMVYALALPIGNSSMWRGTRFDPVGRKILLDAIAGRYKPLYADFNWRPVPAGRVHFSDDFMRVSGEGRAWMVESGKFRLTGAPPPPPPRYSRRKRLPGPKHPFALCGFGPGFAAAGNADWQDYRLSLSLLADHGEGGLWLTTSGRRRLILQYSSTTGRLSLLKTGADKTDKIILVNSADIPGPRRGWRRISLFSRHGAWQAWIDGHEAMRMPAGNETSQGRFGIAHARGEVYYDDVSVRDVSTLIPGTDRCLGEEGSCRSDVPIREGLEPRTIYSCQWYLRPDDLGRHAFVSALPLYAPARFRMDGKTLGMIKPDHEGPLVYLPAGRTPRHELAIVTGTWHDYNFFGQPVDWYTTGADWHRVSRWSCDQKWEWLGVKETPGRTALWYRRPLSPPYCISVLCGPTMGSGRGFHEKDRDLNLVVAGNGRDLEHGYLLRTGPARGAGSRLLHKGRVLARARAFGLPAGGGLTLHHRWLWLKAIVEKDRIRFYYEGKLAVDHHLANPPAKGFVGFWTENNTVQVARATLSF